MENSNTGLKPVLNDFGFFKKVPFIIEGLPKLKVINYLGYVVNVPKGFKWLAMDRDGDIFAYVKKPKLSNGYWAAGVNAPDCVYIDDIYKHVDSISEETANASLMKVKDLPRLRF